MPAPRTSAAGRYLLRLEKVDCGFVSSVEGGALLSEVVAIPGRDFFDHKQIGSPRPEEIELRTALALDQAFWDWIAASLGGKVPRRSGSIVAVDAARKARWEREFEDALVTEVAFPALDAAAKNAGQFTVRLAPEAVRTRKGTGKAVGAPATKSKTWLPSNFRLELDGLDCKRVSKVDGFAVTQKTAVVPVGERRVPVRQAAKIEFPDLRIRLAESSGASWLDWHEDFLVRGNNGDGDEKSGRIVLLAPDLKSPLAEVRLFGLGIFRLDREQPQGPSAAALLRADLYCERMELEVF